MTNFELLSVLEKSGWEWKPLPPKAKRGNQKVTWEPDGTLSRRVFFGGFQRDYILCLVLCERMPDRFYRAGTTEVLHFQDAQYYKSMATHGADVGAGDDDDLADLAIDVSSHLPLTSVAGGHPQPPLMDDSDLNPDGIAAESGPDLDSGLSDARIDEDASDGFEAALGEILDQVQLAEAGGEVGAAPSESAEQQPPPPPPPPVESQVPPAAARLVRAKAPQNYILHFETRRDFECYMAPRAGLSEEARGSQLRLSWGSFIFTSKHQGWQAACPWHARSDVTGCRKFRRAAADDEGSHLECIRWLKMWCLESKSYDRQRYHLAAPIDEQALPDHAVLDASALRGSGCSPH